MAPSFFRLQLECSSWAWAGQLVDPCSVNMSQHLNSCLQTDTETDRPIDPPRVLGAEVLWNPFEDIKPRISAAAKAEKQREEEAKR